MSKTNTICEKLIGTCVQVKTDGELIFVTDCQYSSETQQIVISALNMARLPVETIIELKSTQLLSMRQINLDTFLDRLSNCPLCGQTTSKASMLFTVTQLFWEVKVLQCCNCSLAFKEYVPNSLLLEHIYGTGYVHFTEPVNNQREIDKYRPRVERMGQPHGRHLDYGCGAGHLVACAMQAGWDSYGADPYLPDQPIPENMVGRLFRVDVSDSNARYELGKFDCITIWAVFEHLTNLSETLVALAEMLNPGGQLILNAPNSNSLIAQRSGSNWRIAVLLEHIQFCSTSCARWIARQNNLSIHKIRFAGSPFPCGTGPTDARGQGVSILPTEYVTLFENEKNNFIIPPNTHPPTWIKRFTSYVYQHFMSNGGSGLIVSTVRKALNLLRIGDHVEIVFIKNSNFASIKNSFD